MAEMATRPAQSGNEMKPETATMPTTMPESGKMRRRDPFEMFESVQDEMARLWNQAWPFSSWPLSRWMSPVTQGATMWTPKVDVFEKNGDLVVKAELPGAKKEDIEVTLDQGYLMIRGQRRAESEVRDEHYYRMEQSYGSFYRRLALPFETTADKITATYSEGILEIHIPKPAAAPPPTAQSVPIG